MPSTSSISKTSIRPVVQLNSVKPRMFSKKLVPIVQKESFWNKKNVVTKPKKPFTRPEFKAPDKSTAQKFSMNIFLPEKKPTDKKKPNISNIILHSQFYINEEPKSRRNKAVKIFMIAFGVVIVCVTLLALLLLNDISSIAKRI